MINYFSEREAALLDMKVICEKLKMIERRFLPFSVRNVRVITMALVCQILVTLGMVRLVLFVSTAV